MSAVQGFVAKYVRDLAMDERLREAMLTNLREGRPHVQEETMTVAIIDVAGYSALASFLERKFGKLSSEVITSAVGEYMAKIAEVVFRYEGDIVKFLGDALLVTFSATRPSETDDSTSMRALSCCLEILQRYPVHDIDLNQWSQILKASQTADKAYEVYSLPNDHRESLRESTLAKVAPQLEKLTSLTLHIAVARGAIGRVILGVPGRRLDYLVYGDCLTSLGAILDAAKSGEMGISLELFSLIKIEGTDDNSRDACDGFRILRKKDLYRLNDDLSSWTLTRQQSLISRQDTVERTSAVGRSSSVNASKRNTSVCREDMIPEVVAELIKNFVNRSLLFKLNEVMPKNDGLKKGGDNTVKGPDFNILRKRASGTEKTEGQTSGLVRSEYRTVSIMFVKVHGDFDADRAQMFFVKLLGQLDLFNGVFQQYSVDDKGQSMLACFGLPPFANEKCGLIAVRAASRFAQSLLAEDLSKISISVTTGDILFGTVGWEYRKDAALLGDTVNIAARLLSIDKGVILLDDRTKELVKGTFTLSNLGLIRIKGKSLPLSVWAISSFTAMAAKTTNLSESWTQNKAERQILNQSVRLWVERRMLKSTFLVEGESGMGKTTLLVSVQNLYKELSVLSCIARGSEVDQLNSFMAVRDILMQLLKIRLACASTRDSSLTISTIVTTGRTSVIDSSLFGLDKGDMEGILRDANENIGFASLLLVMIKGDSCSTYKAEDDKSGRASVNGTRKDGAGFMNDEVRRRALKFALVRVISHLCVKYRVAIMLDDAQWIDFSSLEVFYILADEHPDVYMTIFTRPIKNVESGSFLHRFLASTFVHHLPLVGMSLEDLSIILAQYMNAKSVESKLLNDIYQQTHGNLLQTESLLRYLLEHFDEVVVVDKNGQLCGKNYEALQMIVSRSVEAVIMSQFDRLHTEYQHILRYASILGQYVDLHELSLLLDAENVQADDIRSLIAIHDQFDFLRPCEGAFADSGSEVYYFRHITIMNAIYQSVSFAEREELHLLIAEHLDRFITSNPGKRIQVLPTVCYHYWRTRNAARILERVSELGFHCIQNFLLLEARKSLQSVSDYISDNSVNLQASLESKDRYLLEPLFHCRILANLAMTKANLRDFPGALDAAVKCIDFAGLDWPTHPKAIKKRILRLFRRTVKHWIKSNNGRSNIRVSTKSPKELQPDWFPIISIALDTFILIISYASLNKLHTVLVVLWSLSQAYVTSETDPSFLFKILFYSSWICALHGGSVACKLSWVMMKQCRTLQPRCDSTIKSLFHIYYTLMFLYFGTTRRSLEAVREYEEYWMERRVKFQYYKALDFYGIFSIYNGDLKYLKPRLTDEWAAEMKSIDIFWYCAITGVYQIDCFLKNDVESLEKFNTRQKEVQHLVPILTILRCGSSIKVNDLFLLILRGSPGNVLLEASANALLEVIEVGVSASHHTPTIAALSVCIPTVGLCNAGLPLNADAVKRLIVLLSKFRKEVKVMSRYGWLVKFGSLLALTSTYHLMGAPSKIVKQVRRLLALPEFKDDIHMGGDKCFVGACCCAIIALSSRDESEVRVNRKRAIEMFEEMGLWVMIKWVSNEMKYAEQ